MKNLTHMFPDELKKAGENKTPIIIAGGTIEYHGSHCAYGCDGIIAEKMVELVAKERDVIIAPTIWYSPSSYAVGDKTSGTVHVEEDAFENYVYYIFRSMLYSGLKNIYVVIHHQFEEENAMPMTLCYMKAAKKAIMRYLEDTLGEGWWGAESYKNYYSELESDNPFDWIKVIPTMSTAAQHATGYDHAGKYETSLLMALDASGVDTKKLGLVKHWYTQNSVEASAALGNEMLKASMPDLIKRIK